MTFLRLFLILSTLVIYAFTVIAVSNNGFNWPAVALGDLLSFNWRSQFDIDLIIHLLLLASWIVWREGATIKGYIFGVLSVVMGGMFGFPYLLYASFKANGDTSALLLGVHATAPP